MAIDMFNKYDEDNSGEIDFGEFANIMTDISEAFDLPPPTGLQIDEALKQIDTNQDGKLSFEELEPVLTTVIQSIYEIQAHQEEQEAF